MIDSCRFEDFPCTSLPASTQSGHSNHSLACYPGKLISFPYFIVFADNGVPSGLVGCFANSLYVHPDRDKHQDVCLYYLKWEPLPEVKPFSGRSSLCLLLVYFLTAYYILDEARVGNHGEGRALGGPGCVWAGSSEETWRCSLGQLSAAGSWESMGRT